MPDRSPDRAIDGLARRQHGVFHRRQAVRIGMSAKQVRTRLHRGSWIPLLDSDVYALPSHPGTWLRQCMAATLAVPASAVSGPSAASLLGFPGWPRAQIETVTRHDSTNRSPFGRVRQSHTVGRILVAEGIRVVSRADCLTQLAAQLDADALGDLVDDVAHDHRLLLPQLRDHYAALARSRLPGIGRIRQVLQDRGDGYVPPASELERRLRAVLTSVPGLPAVEWEATPPWLELCQGRVDARIKAWRLIVEADGRPWHTRVEDFERDRWRDNEALTHGYATVRLTWLHLTHAQVACRNLLVAVGAERSGCGRPDGSPGARSIGSATSGWSARR